MTDKELKQQVENALDWEPSLDATDIGVSVDDGVVTLRGNVPSFSAKMTAERVVLHLYGVRAMANDLAVRLPRGFERTDTEIAQAAATALRWHTLIPSEGVTVSVANGWITLGGELDWHYQKDAAAAAVRDLTGVKGLVNHILVKPHVQTADVIAKIEAAFKRSAEVDARRIAVAAENGKVVLSGTVHSWAERQEAERAAWAAPGVRQVVDHLTVVP